MPEQLRQLSDFFDPTRAGMAAINVMQNRQHLAMQQKQADQQGRNMEIDNLQKALKSANPMDAWPIQDKLSNMLGVPSVPIDKYLANQGMYNALLAAKPGTPEHDKAASEFAATTPESQKIMMDVNSVSRSREGAGVLLSAAKMDPKMAELAMNNPSMLKELTDSQAQSPKQVEEARRLQMMNQEHEGKVAAFKTFAEPLMESSSGLGLKMQRVTPYIDKIKEIEDEYVKDLDRHGSIKASGKRLEAMKLNPEIQQMDDARKVRAKELKGIIANIENQQAKLEVRANGLAWGAHDAQPGESIHLSTGEVDKTYFDLMGARAELKVSESPTHANLEALGEVKAKIDGYVKMKFEEKMASEQSLNIRRDAQQETARKNQYTEKVSSVSNEGQRSFAALPKAQQTTQAAARIAGELQQRHGVEVGTEEIMKGVKDPNNPLVSLTNKIDTVVPASVEAQREYMKGARTTYDQLKQAHSLLENIERAKELIPKAKGFMGPGGETLLEAAKFLNNRMGMNVATTGIKSAEELRSRIFFNIMDNLKKMDAQPSQQQQQVMQDSLGKLGTDPQALAEVLDAYGDSVRGKVQQYNDDVASAEERGVKFPYDPQIRLKSSNKGSGAFDDAEKERRYQEYKRKNVK